MNELEKTVAPQEELSAPTNAAQAEVAENEAAVVAEENETVVETLQAAQVEVAEEMAEAVDSPEVEEPKKEDLRRFHGMDKQGLIDALTQILEADNMQGHKEVAAIKQSFYILRNKETEQELNEFVEAGNDPMAFAATPDPMESQFKELLANFRERRNAFLEAEEKRKEENLAKKREIIAKITALVEDIDNVNVRFPEFQQLQQDFKDIKDVPASAETDLWKQYQRVVEQFFDHLKMNRELRDLAFKRNLEAKRGIIEEAKALAELEDVVAASRKLQDLHARWKDLGPVEKNLREEIWEEFRTASANVNRRHQDFMLARKEREAANEAAKTRLCEAVEAISTDDLKSFSAWDAQAKKIQELQAEWRTYGYASKKVNNDLYSRFRKACDDFFDKRGVFFKSHREMNEQNLARKTALCEEVEKLRADETISLRDAIEKVQKLQAEWKTIGPVSRKVSDAIWERFITNCNYFFDLRKKQTQETRKTESANLEKKNDIIARLKALPKDGDRNEVLEQVRELRIEWSNVGHVPMRAKDRIYEEFKHAIDEIYAAFNYREQRNRLNNYEQRLNKMSGDGARMSREEDILARQLDQKKNELATYQNNLGFFKVKSSAGNSMLAEMERKAARIKDEIAEIEKKMEMLKASASEEDNKE